MNFDDNDFNLNNPLGNKLLENNPLGNKQLDPQTLSALAAYMARNYREAEGLLLHAMEDKLNLALTLLLLDCFQKLGYYESTIDFGIQAMEIDPKSYVACMLIGEAYQILGYRVKSNNWLEEGLELALTELKRITTIVPKTEPTNELINELTDELKTEPTNELTNEPTKATILNSIASIHILQGKFEESIKFSNEALKCVRPELIHHDYHNIGCALKGMKKYTEAIDCFKKALEHEPDHPDSCFDMGECYEQLGNIPEAVKWIEKAVELSPEWIKLSDKLHEIRKDKGSRCYYCNRIITLNEILESDYWIDEALEDLSAFESMLDGYSRNPRAPPYTHIRDKDESLVNVCMRCFYRYIDHHVVNDEKRD